MGLMIMDSPIEGRQSSVVFITESFQFVLQGLKNEIIRVTFQPCQFCLWSGFATR